MIHKREKSLKGEKENAIAEDLHDIRAISSGHQNIQIENNIQIVCEIWRTVNGKKAPEKKEKRYYKKFKRLCKQFFNGHN